MAYSKGSYDIKVTMTQGCEIEFKIPEAAKSWVHITPTKGGSGTYEFIIDDGNHGNTTVEVYVNGEHCSSRDIAIESPSVCTCNDLHTTAHTAPATVTQQGQSFTIISYDSSNNCLEVTTATTDVDWFTIEGYTNGSVVGRVTKDNGDTTIKTGTVNLTIKVKGGDTCTNAVPVTITQNAPGCVCEELTISSVGAFDSNEHNHATLATNLNFGCLVNTGITFENNDWISSTGITNGSVTGKVATYSNATTTSPRTVTITVTGKTSATAAGTCSKTATVTQNPPSCTPSTCYTVSEATANVSAIATRANVTWQYTATTTDSNCQPHTQTGSESKEVEFAAVTDCSDLTESGSFTWRGHTACGGSSDVTVHWTVYQAKPEWCDCSCDDIIVSANLDYDHNEHNPAFLGNITFDPCVADTGITWDWYGGRDWITNTGYSQNVLTGNMASNNSLTQDRYVLITATGNTATEQGCSKQIKVTQFKNTVSCDCSDLIVIARESEEVDWEEVDWGKNVFLTSVDEEYTFTYKFKEDKDACFEGTDVTFSYNSTDAEYFIISTGTTGGKSYIKIKPNPDKDPNQIDIFFDYTLSDGTNCSTQWGYNSITVIYNPACKCDDLLPEDACIQRDVPLAAGTYPLGKFGVVGCGEFSGKSTSSQVENVIINKVNDKYEVSVQLKRYGDEYGHTPPEQPDAPSDIDIYSLENGKALKNCHHIYRIRQTKDYVDCNRIHRINFVDDGPSYAENSTAYLAKLSDSDGMLAFSKLDENDIITSFSTEYDWIDSTSLYIDTAYATYIRGHIYANESSQSRSNKITINFDKDKLRQIFGICEDCINKPFTVTVNQQGDPSYDCACPDDEEVEIKYYGAEASFDCKRVRNDCFASTGLKFIPVDFSNPGAFYNDYVEVNDWLSIKLSVQSDPSAPNKSYLNVAYKALGHTYPSQERSYTFKIKYNFDPSKQQVECIQEVAFNQEAAINVTCEQLLASIGTSSINARATATTTNVRDDFAWMNTRLMDGVRLSGETVQSQDCGDGSWITRIEPGTGNYDNHLYVTMTQNVSEEHDHSTNERCAKIRIFYIDEQGNRLKIGDSECGSIEAVLTQNGYSGDCLDCSEATLKLPTPNYTPYCDETYTEEGIPYAAFNDGDGQHERSLFEITIPNDYYYDGTDENRCFDLTAKTTHDGSFTPYSDGENLHVTLDTVNRKWVITGILKPATASVTSVAVEVYIQRRNLAGGDSTQCKGTAYITDFVVLHK